MHQLKYIVYREDKYYVSQCLNVDVASFGNNIDEAVENLKEAVELYLEDETNVQYHYIDNALLGEAVVNA
jgi:predicted RNase H-like HicB family nuclease